MLTCENDLEVMVYRLLSSSFLRKIDRMKDRGIWRGSFGETNTVSDIWKKKQTHPFPCCELHRIFFAIIIFTYSKISVVLDRGRFGNGPTSTVRVHSLFVRDKKIPGADVCGLLCYF